MKTTILADVQICIIVPLSQNKRDWQYTLFLLYNNDLPDHVICDIIYADNISL